MRSDSFSPEKRAAIMRAVKSVDTGPERAVRAAVCVLGYARRYRLNASHLPGKPDLVFGALGKVIFVHGCFWHGHGCARGARLPKQNRDYWLAKIAGNRARDRAARKALRTQGWRALTVWECECRAPATLARKLARFLR
jgi:DNA mismatch endonuclease, patch repair protein